MAETQAFKTVTRL